MNYKCNLSILSSPSHVKTDKSVISFPKSINSISFSCCSSLSPFEIPSKPLLLMPLLYKRSTSFSSLVSEGNAAEMNIIPSLILFNLKNSSNYFRFGNFFRYTARFSQSLSVIVFEHSWMNVSSSTYFPAYSEKNLVKCWSESTSTALSTTPTFLSFFRLSDAKFPLFYYSASTYSGVNEYFLILNCDGS